MREAMADPAPAIDRRTSPRRSNSVTLAAQPRTFEDILPWPGFRNGAQQYFSSLDNTSRLYRQATYDILDGEDDEPAADEAEVRGFVMRLLRSVNTAAKQLGIQVRYSGGGSGRSLSRTDLVVRVAGDPHDPKDLSSRNLGVIEVKVCSEALLSNGLACDHSPQVVGCRTKIPRPRGYVHCMASLKRVTSDTSI